MAELVEDFEGGAPGDTITTGNTILTSVEPVSFSQPFFLDYPHSGVTGASCAGDGANLVYFGDPMSAVTAWVLSFVTELIGVAVGIVRVDTGDGYATFNRLGDVEVGFTLGFAYETAEDGYVEVDTGVPFDYDTWYQTSVTATAAGGLHLAWYAEGAVLLAEVDAPVTGYVGSLIVFVGPDLVTDDWSLTTVGAVAPVRTSESFTRIYPRDSSSAARVYPPPRTGRLVGGQR